MGFIGVQPATVPLTSSDITDGIISTAKIANDAVDNTKLDLTDNYAFTGTISGAGKILQILQNTSTNTDAISSGATSTIVTQAITPSSSSNKILIFVSINIGGDNNSYGYGQIKRGTTVIGAGATSSSRPLVSFGIMSALNANFDYRMGNHNFTFLDSPSTTSETTYKCDVTCTVPTLRTNKTTQDGNNTLGIRGMSTMTLFEVVA